MTRSDGSNTVLWAGVLLAGVGLCLTVLAAFVRDHAAPFVVLILTACALVVAGVALLVWDFLGAMRVVNEEKEELVAATDGMDALVRLSSQVALARPLGEILEGLHSIGGRMLGNSKCVIFEAKEELRVVFRRDVSLDLCKHMQDAYRTRQGLFASARHDLAVVTDAIRDPRLLAARMVLDAESLRSLVFVPLVYEEFILGFLFLFYDRPRSFTLEEMSLSSAFASQAAVAIRNGQLREDLDNALRDYQAMFDNASDPIWTIDAAGTCTAVNRRAEELTGRKAGEWTGRPFVDSVVEEDKEQVLVRIGAALAGQPQRLDLRLSTPQGPVYIAASTTPINRDGDVTSAVIFGRDLSEERRLTERLVSAQRMESLGVLARGIAHDFNNILTSILGHATLVRTKIPEDSPAVHHLDLIESSAERAGDLTNQLRRFARRSKMRGEWIDLNRILKETVALTERTVERTIGIRLELAEPLAPVVGDRTQIQQVFINLVLNARDSMEGKGTIWMKTLKGVLDQHKARSLGMRPGPCVVVGARDSGPGIRPEERARIFEPLYAMMDSESGTGLGLSIVHRIMQDHGGAVELSSTPGHGATFTLYFPLVTEVGPEATLPAAAGTKEARGTETILLVDDEPAVVEFLAEILQHAGYKALTARGGEEALDVHAEKGREIDLVVLDVVMPGMDGSDVFARLRERNKDLPVLIMSGLSREDDVHALLSASANGLLRKPFLVHDLLQKVREILDRRQSMPAAKESGD